MTRIVILGAAYESVHPIGLEQGARYVLRSGPFRAVLNDSSDPDHVGFLTEPPSGFDTADVRQVTELRADAHGARHGAFLLGARPWTMTGIFDHAPRPSDLTTDLAVVGNRRVNALERATRALRADAIVEWTPAGGMPVRIMSRLQALRVTERLPKRFQLAMVAADPAIYSQVMHSVTEMQDAPITAVNEGDTPSPLVMTLTGPWVDPIVTNGATGETLALNAGDGIAMTTGDRLVIDAEQGTIELNGVNAYDRMLWPGSTWLRAMPGSNVLTATGGAVGAGWSVAWRDAWKGGED